MSEIKTSYELALERTKDIQPDHQSLIIKNCKEKGYRLFASFLKDSSVSISERLRAISEDELSWVMDGLEEILLQNLSLPSQLADLEPLQMVRTGFLAIKQQKEPVVTAFSRIEQLFRQYLQEREQFSDRLKAHLSPLVREKAQQLQQQLGRPVPVDIERLPEFITQLRRGYEQLEENYRKVVRPVKDQLSALPRAS